MANQLKQPATGTVVTTTLGTIIDFTLPSQIVGLKSFAKTDGTVKQRTRGRNETNCKTSLKLTKVGGTSPYSKYKAIWERWTANASESCELTLDLGGGEVITITGKIDKITPTGRAGESTIQWIVTISIAAESVSFA